MKQLIQVGVLGVGLLFALSASYMVYFESGDAGVDEKKGAAAYIATPEQLKSVSYVTDEKTVLLSRKSDAIGEWLEVAVTTRTEVQPELPAPV
ncbi:MAG: hypothetical protein AB8H79_03420, partial [Myxococcota bacterium]